jgi:hypothetical protein
VLYIVIFWFLDWVEEMSGRVYLKKADVHCVADTKAGVLNNVTSGFAGRLVQEDRGGAKAASQHSSTSVDFAEYVELGRKDLSKLLAKAKRFIDKALTQVSTSVSGVGASNFRTESYMRADLCYKAALVAVGDEEQAQKVRRLRADLHIMALNRTPVCYLPAGDGLSLDYTAPLIALLEGCDDLTQGDVLSTLKKLLHIIETQLYGEFVDSAVQLEQGMQDQIAEILALLSPELASRLAVAVAQHEALQASERAMHPKVAQIKEILAAPLNSGQAVRKAGLSLCQKRVSKIHGASKLDGAYLASLHLLFSGLTSEAETVLKRVGITQQLALESKEEALKEVQPAVSAVKSGKKKKKTKAAVDGSAMFSTVHDEQEQAVAATAAAAGSHVDTSKKVKCYY